MSEYWTPEQQGQIAEAVARIRQDGTISGLAVPGVGYVYADGSVLHEASDTLYICFSYSDTVWQSRELDTSGEGSPFVKL